MPPKLKSLLNSRRFQVAVVTVVAIVSQDLAGVDLNIESLVAITSIAIGWILGDSKRKTE